MEKLSGKLLIYCYVTNVTQQRQVTSASQNDGKWKFQWRKRWPVLFSQNKAYDEPEWRYWPGIAPV